MQEKMFFRLLPAGCVAAALLSLVWACKAPLIPPYEEEMDRTQEVKAEAPQPQAQIQIEERKGDITFSETAFDVGDVQRGEWAAHTFTIKNKSDRPLHINRVRGG